MSRAGFYGIALTVVAVDQLVKAWVRRVLPDESSLPIWPGVFQLTHTQNRGMAFSLLEGAIPLLAAAAFLVIGVIVVAQIRVGSRMSPLFGVALALPLGGAVGNLIDRMTRHSVTDLFDFRLINFPVFNVADAAITIGVLLLAWRTLTVKEEGPVPDDPSAMPTPSGEGR